MRNSSSIILFTFLSLLISQQAKGQFVSYNQIEDGKYEANVYYSSTTGKKATYQLMITVLNDAVTAIHFGNNGSVHTGFNNEGYTFSGGSLSFTRDYNRKITGASTTVIIKDANGAIQKFQIEIN